MTWKQKSCKMAACFQCHGSHRSLSIFKRDVLYPGAVTVEVGVTIRRTSLRGDSFNG